MSDGITSDEIDADTGPMVRYRADGPTFADPDQPLRSAMAEGAAFAQAENRAAQNVKTYAKNANTGISAYVQVATTSGRDYFDTDAASRAMIENVTKG